MFTVVIPLYNKAHTIERTLKSVINQTYTNFEVIIVDDGSTDNGVETINKLTNDTRIKIIQQENQGVSVARNIGVANAKYEYIAFLDGDDTWESKYLETIFEIINKYPECGMICCATYYKDDQTGNIGLRIAKKYKNKITEINFFENPHTFFQTSATVISKNIFNKTTGFPIGMRKNEDFVLFFSVALLTKTVYCGIPLTTYYGNIKGQATTVNQLDRNKTDLDVIERFNQTYKLWNSLERKNNTFKIFLKYEFRHIILTSIRQNDFNKIELFLKNIDSDILKLFPYLEIENYKKKHRKKLNTYYLFITKTIWRMRGFPRVGQQ
ncbi:glycosyltransferase family 2 protein [Lutibacter sp.]